MSTLVIADIHGHYDELLEILEPHFDSGVDLIFLGDLIDRASAPNGDINVLNLVHDIDQDPGAYGFASCTVLKGNHEVLFLDAVYHDDYDLWSYNGGDMYAIDEIMEHFEWLYELPAYTVRGDHLFVHAGVRPDVPLEEQEEFDMTWIRNPFLTSKDHGLPYTIVHGHTITNSGDIEYYPGRIAMDTGSFLTGKIGNLVLDC